MANVEYTAHQRAAMVTVWLQGGSRLTTAQVATLTGLGWNGAEYMLSMISTVLPIVEDDEGKWHWVKADPSR